MAYSPSCDWYTAGEGQHLVYAENAIALFVQNYTWEKAGPPPPPGPLLLDGTPVSTEPIGHGRTRAISVRLPLGDHVFQSGTCSWLIHGGATADHAPPTWVEAPHEGPTPRNKDGLPETFMHIWAATLSEPGWVVAWKADPTVPTNLIVAEMDAVFCVWFGSDAPVDPRLVATEQPFVVRPMDNAGNFGPAYRIDPARHEAELLADGSAYCWPDLTASLPTISRQHRGDLR